MLTATSQRHNGRYSLGFTLVELLVVIAIIGVLVALLLPAVNAARGRARQAQCTNNQAQLGKAVLSYATTKNRMPAVTQDLILPATVVQVGWTYPILPMVEQQALRDLMDNNQMPNITPQIAIFQCPNDPAPEEEGAQLSYVANSGVADIPGNTDPEVRDDGSFSRKPYGQSPQYKKSFENDLSFISQSDGTVTTIMISENVHALNWDNGSEPNNGLIWAESNTPPTAATMSALLFNNTLKDQSTLSNGPSSVNPFHRLPSSKHKGGFVVTFCGGNARFISQNINGTVYGRLMTSKGQTVSPTIARQWQMVPLSESDLEGL